MTKVNEEHRHEEHRHEEHRHEEHGHEEHGHEEHGHEEHGHEEHGHEEHGHEEHHVFHYMVDDERQTTHNHVLTPLEILTSAGLNPSTYYLVQIRNGEQVSYKDKYDEKIHMHQDMKFISVYIGDTPVSELA